MENIIVTHPDGTTTPLLSRSKVSTLTKAEQKVALLGDDIVELTVASATPIVFALGDTIEAYGKTYTLNVLPNIKKTGTNKFTYDLTFEGPQYELIDAQFLLPEDRTTGDSLTGDFELFFRILVENINRVFPGKWQLGVFPTGTEVKTLSYAGENCLSVLQNLCGEYAQEFEIVQAGGVRTLHIRTAGANFPYTFRYGRTGGLYELTRQNINSKNLVTRLYLYGGTANLGSAYRHSRLCLPGKSKNLSYIESAAVAAFGVKENVKNFDTIFPNRYGEVSVQGAKYYAFVDNTMNFDLNETEDDGTTTKWLIAGVNAKVKMTTGNLAGYEFDVHRYDSATQTIEVVPFTDENGMKFPSETSVAFQFGVGDKYFFVDINLPDTYKTDAEAALQEEGETYYAQNCQPQVQYGLSIDQNFIEQFAGNLTVVNLFAPGDYVPVEDEDIGVDKSIRVLGFTRDLLKPYKYSLNLGDSVTKSAYTRVISDLKVIDKIVEINNLADPSAARRNWRATQEVLSMVFDPDGDYYSEKIKPESVDTAMLSVGAKSMQFVLRNVIFEPNYQGNPNYLRVSGGQLIHYTIEDTIRTWNIATLTYSDLASDTACYIYARCAKQGDEGSIILDTAQRPVDSEAAYYNFWIGVLNSVETGGGGNNPARLVSLTYGSSTVAGRFIKTGRIESSGGGSTYFDLDSGEIGGNIKFTAADGTSKNVSDLDTVAQETKDYIDNTLPGVLSEIQSQLDGQIEQFFDTYDPTTSNAPANAWTTTALKENHLGDLFYNTGNGKVFRWVKQGSTYFWQELQDNEVAEALAIANDALALAQAKRRIFTTTPAPPYDIGDLWVQGTNGDIMRCRTARATGSYTASDWEKASNYTSDAALNNFINGTYATTITDLTNQLDGKIESWFQTSDPAAAWTTAALRTKHAGDMWYSSATKLLKRYTGSTWTTIEDQRAIDAYTVASTAQDTADGKRRVFVNTPYPPYDVGDLWVNGQDLRRCVTRRVSGSYYSYDWDLATTYDNTKTTIDGGVVTSGTIQLAGSGGSILAGVTGDGTASSSVRIWAGTSFPNRTAAPFRVLQDGSFVATKAQITGELNATKGTFKNVTVEGSVAQPWVLWSASASPNQFQGDAQGLSRFDNIAMPTTSNIELSSSQFSWRVEDSGRVIRICQYRWNTQESNYIAIIKAPSGKYFYENGKQYSSLRVARELITLVGYGTASTFYGWIVQSRTLVMPSGTYGAYRRVLYQGYVYLGSSTSYDFRVWSADLELGHAANEDWFIEKIGTGQYRVGLPISLSASYFQVYLHPTTTNYAGSSRPTGFNCYATVTKKGQATYGDIYRSYFEVWTADDASSNDSPFMFEVVGSYDWRAGTVTRAAAASILSDNVKPVLLRMEDLSVDPIASEDSTPSVVATAVNKGESGGVSMTFKVKRDGDA